MVRSTFPALIIPKLIAESKNADPGLLFVSCIDQVRSSSFERERAHSKQTIFWLHTTFTPSGKIRYQNGDSNPKIDIRSIFYFFSYPFCYSIFIERHGVFSFLETSKLKLLAVPDHESAKYSLYGIQK